MLTEPTRFISLLNAAIAITLAAVAYAFDWSGEAVSLMTGVFGAWIILAGEYLRSRVTPVTTDANGVTRLVNPSKINFSSILLLAPAALLLRAVAEPNDDSGFIGTLLWIVVVLIIVVIIVALLRFLFGGRRGL